MFPWTFSELCELHSKFFMITICQTVRHKTKHKDKVYECGEVCFNELICQRLRKFFSSCHWVSFACFVQLFRRQILSKITNKLSIVFEERLVATCKITNELSIVFEERLVATANLCLGFTWLDAFQKNLHFFINQLRKSVKRIRD